MRKNMFLDIHNKFRIFVKYVLLWLEISYADILKLRENGH